MSPSVATLTVTKTSVDPSKCAIAVLLQSAPPALFPVYEHMLISMPERSGLPLASLEQGIFYAGSRMTERILIAPFVTHSLMNLTKLPHVSQCAEMHRITASFGSVLPSDCQP